MSHVNKTLVSSGVVVFKVSGPHKSVSWVYTEQLQNGNEPDSNLKIPAAQMRKMNVLCKARNSEASYFGFVFLLENHDLECDEWSFSGIGSCMPSFVDEGDSCSDRSSDGRSLRGRLCGSHRE